MADKRPSSRPKYTMLVKLLNLGSVIFVLALLGIWLDQKFHTIPVYTVIGIVLGVLYSFYEAWQIYRQE